MSRILSFKDLKVWQKAHELNLCVYKLQLPAHENYNLVSQMRRSSTSIAANIAEGFAKRSLRDQLNFYNVAQGSLNELEYYLILCKQLGYLESVEEIVDRITEIRKMIYGVIRALRNLQSSH